MTFQIVLNYNRLLFSSVCILLIELDLVAVFSSLILHLASCYCIMKWVCFVFSCEQNVPHQQHTQENNSEYFFRSTFVRGIPQSTYCSDRSPVPRGLHGCRNSGGRNRLTIKICAIDFNHFYSCNHIANILS